MRKVLIAVAVVALMVGNASAYTINWGVNGTSNTNAWFEHDGTTLVSPTANVSSNRGDGLSALVQLIYAGANGVIDPAYSATGQIPPLTLTNGASADDVVVAFSYMGAGEPLTVAPGHFIRSGASGYSSTYAAGSVFYTRVWELPAAYAGSGYIATNVPGGQLYYNNSPTFTVGTLGLNENFYTASSISTTQSLTVIPEPGSLQLLMFLGTAFIMRRRMRKSVG